MASAFDKQHSSRQNITQVLAYLGGGATVASTNFGSATQQIRVVSEVQGWLSIGASTTVTVGSNGLKISANVEGESFTVTPGQIAAFNSTSTSTGFVSIAEMA
jgi:hypothetical protein